MQALCPQPLPDRARIVPAAPERGGPAILRRTVRGAGVLLASAAAVVGLGVLAELAAAVQAPAGAPAPVSAPVSVQDSAH